MPLLGRRAEERSGEKRDLVTAANFRHAYRSPHRYIESFHPLSLAAVQESDVYMLLVLIANLEHIW